MTMSAFLVVSFSIGIAFLTNRAAGLVENRALISSALAACCSPEKRSCCRKAIETDRPLKCGFNESTAIDITSCLEQELWGPTDYNHRLANCCKLLPQWRSCRLSCFNKFNAPSIDQFDKLKFMEDCPINNEDTAEEHRCFSKCMHRTALKVSFDRTTDCQFPNNRPLLRGQELGKRMF